MENRYRKLAIICRGDALLKMREVQLCWKHYFVHLIDNICFRLC